MHSGPPEPPAWTRRPPRAASPAPAPGRRARRARRSARSAGPVGTGRVGTSRASARRDRGAGPHAPATARGALGGARRDGGGTSGAAWAGVRLPARRLVGSEAAAPRAECTSAIRTFRLRCGDRDGEQTPRTRSPKRRRSRCRPSTDRAGSRRWQQQPLRGSGRSRFQSPGGACTREPSRKRRRRRDAPRSARAPRSAAPRVCCPSPSRRRTASGRCGTWVPR
jgi:hypothetical protein